MPDLPLFPSSLVGSYAQPDWLIDRTPARRPVPAPGPGEELWRLAPELLAQAQDDATLLAIRAQERRRARHRHRRRDAPGELLEPLRDGARGRRRRQPRRRARPQRSPQPGAARRRPGRAGGTRSRSTTSLPPRPYRPDDKITIPGPFTMAQQAQDDYYGDLEALAMAYAEAVNAEAGTCSPPAPTSSSSTSRTCRPGRRPRRSSASGAQPGPRGAHRDDRRAPVLRVRRHHPRPAVGILVPARARRGDVRPDLDRDRAVGLDCAVLRELPGKTIILGVIDLSTTRSSPPATVARRVERALPYVAPERIVVATDCGMKYLPRESAEGKLRALAHGAALLRGGGSS